MPGISDEPSDGRTAWVFTDAEVAALLDALALAQDLLSATIRANVRPSDLGALHERLRAIIDAEIKLQCEDEV